MNLKFKDIFSGKLVNKAHTIDTGVDEFPRYVLEYLIDNWCEEDTFIASLEARLAETEDKYWGSISAINENFVNISESVVRQYPMLLSGGMGGPLT